jgi:hypothetical protein
MKRIRGKIASGQKVLFDDLEVWVHIEAPDMWRGDFAIPHDQALDAITLRLIAHDGREGDIRICKVSPSNHGETLVNFRGESCFETPRR